MAYGQSPEQIDRHEKSRTYRKFLKKRSKKARRLAEKTKLEEAPLRNRYRGYST